MAYNNPTGLPSPSDVLRPFINSDFFTEAGRDRGNKVHDACRDHLFGKYVVISRPLRGYYDSFRRWCDEEQPEPLHVEERLINQYFGYCGQPDFVGKIKNRPGIGVADWKSSTALGKAWCLQVAGYRKLVDNAAWGCSIRLKEDGKYPLVNYYPNFETDFNMFLSALNLYRYFNT
jgi:hypothetical protein